VSPSIRRHATTIALSVLALGGAVAVFVFDRGSATTEEAETRKRNLLETFRRDAITELTVTAKGRTARVVRGELTPSGQRPWEVLIGGQRYPADEATVDQYLGSLELGVFERRVPAGSVDRASLGLDAPRVTIALSMDGRTTNAVIGGAAPLPEGASYAEVTGRGVVVITRELASALDAEPDLFRTRALVPFAPSDLARVQLDGKGGARPLERATWGSSRGPGFRFDGSTLEGRVRASAPALERVLGALGDLEADVFLSDEEADRAFSKEVTLTLVSRTEGGARAVIDVGGACPGHDDLVVAIRREPSRISACVPESVLAPLGVPAEELVDLRPIAAAPDAVIEVKLTAGDKALELARKGTSWHMRAPSDRDVEAGLGRSFLEGLLSVKASNVASGGAGPGPSSPRATVRVVSTTEASSMDGGVSDDRAEVIEVFAEEGGVVLVRRQEDGALLSVPADRAASYFPSELSLRSREVISEPSKRFRALRVRAGEKTQRLRRTEEGGWELLEPTGKGLGADDALATELAERLGSLTAERWASAKDDGSFGLDRPRVVIEAEIGNEAGESAGADTDTGADTHTGTGAGAGAGAGTGADTGTDAGAGAGPKILKLLIGAPSTEGSFAALAGDAAVFIAPRELERAADLWFIDRSSLRVDPGSIARVTLTAEGGAKVHAERSGDVWRIRSSEPRDAGAGASPAQAAAIRDALAELVAEGAVSIGEPEKDQGLTKPQLTLEIERVKPEGAPSSEPPPKPVTIAFGAGDVWRGTRIYYARRSGVDATFAVAQAKVRPLLNAVGAR
jgi:hypothetical protein